jgi:hypothetical protein
MEPRKRQFLDEAEFFPFAKFRELILANKDFKPADLWLGPSHEIYQALEFLTKNYGEWIYEIPLRITELHDLGTFLPKIKKNAEIDTNRSKTEYAKVIKKLINDEPMTVSDVFSLSWIWEGDQGIYHSIKFTPSQYTLTSDQKNEIQEKASEYLNLFENDLLQVNRHNYYRFEMQKKAFIDRIEKQDLIAKHGNNFILSESVNAKSFSKKDSNFLLLQTAYAMEDMGYLTVHHSWRGNASEIPYADTLGEGSYILNVNIEINENLFSLLKQEYQKQNPKNLFEKYNVEKGIIRFAGQEIHLGKKGKETDAMRLMETLAHIEPEEWIERGEVYMGWGLTKDDQDQMAKNKVYYAKQAINEAVARKTKIEDFIEGGTRKWRINPLYQKKVDE